MSKFAETKDGSFVLSSEIVSVRNAGEFECMITTRRGDSHSVAGSAFYIAEEAQFDNGLAIPAQPGYSVVRTIFSEERQKRECEVFPVVGWFRLPADNRDIDKLFKSIPIVTESVEHAHVWSLVLPDGRVVDRHQFVYSNIQEWFEAEVAEDEIANRMKSKKGKTALVNNDIRPK